MMSDFTELKNMRARGELSVQEFLEMVRALRTEDSRTEEPAEEVRDGESEEEPDVVPAASGRPPSVVHVEAQEDGTPNGQENASAAPSSAASHSGQSVSSSTAGGTNTTSRSSSTTSSNKQVQAKPFLPGEKLIHTIYGDVTFVRYGNSLDFLNDGRCRISYQRVKRGCKNKMETWNSWSLPSILSRPMPSESTDGEGSSTCRQAESGAADDTDDEVVITRLDKVGPKPTLAGIERDRKLPQKRKSEGKLGVQHGEHKTKASKIPAHQRVSEFPEESLTVSAGEVMCRACSRSLFNKHSTIDGHVKGAKHIRNLADWNARGGEDIQVKHRLVEYYKSHPNEVCSSLDGDTLLFRYRLTECLLHAGIALGKADFLRPLLERCGQSMTAATHLKVLVPKIEEDELSRIRHEVKGQYVSLVFDGTTRVGEATAMVMRWCNSNFSVVQRLVMLTTTLKHMDAKEMGRLLTEHVMLELKTRSDQVVCMTRDSCSTNGLASRRMRILLTSAEDILCVCHTLNHVGDHFQLPQLDPFITSWIGLIYSSPTAKAIWKQLLGINASVVGYSAVRWYAKAEIVMQIAQNFPLISEALTAFEEKGVGQAHRTRLRELYDQHHDHIELQCAAILDMRPVVATTYELEGDRLEILLAYERIEALRQLGRTIESKGPLPNVDALLQKRIQVGIGTKIRKEWPGQGMFDGEVVDEFDDLVSTLYPDGREVRGFQVKYAADGTTEDLEEAEIRKWLVIDRDAPERKIVVDGLVQGFKYLEDRLAGHVSQEYFSCKEMYEVLNIIRVFDPSYVNEKQVDEDYVDKLVRIKPIAMVVSLASLKSELAKYRAEATGVTFNRSDVTAFSEGVLLWWRNHGERISSWASAAQIAFSMTPTSASCERVFSLLDGMFGSDQLSALSDIIQSAVMLRYNKRKVG